MKQADNKDDRLSTKGSLQPEFFSKQVSTASYYYQTLTPRARDRLVVVCGGREECLPSYRVRRADFRYHSIEFVAAGKGELILGKKRFPLRPGTVFYYGPKRPHTITTDRHAPMTKYFVDFAGTGATALLKNAAFRDAPIQTRDPIRIVETLTDIERSAGRASDESREICALLLRALSLRIAELAIPTPPSGERALYTYQNCLAIIESDYMRLRNLADIGRACHVAPAYICRLFKRFSDTSPRRHLIRLRMQYAANQLQNPAALVQDVADELGYSDPFHFSRAFKQIHGLSPQRFRALAARADTH